MAFHAEWRDALDRFEALATSYQQGHMQPLQVEGFRQSMVLLRSMNPILQRLRLAEPDSARPQRWENSLADARTV